MSLVLRHFDNAYATSEPSVVHGTAQTPLILFWIVHFYCLQVCRAIKSADSIQLPVHDSESNLQFIVIHHNSVEFRRTNKRGNLLHSFLSSWQLSDSRCWYLGYSVQRTRVLSRRHAHPRHKSSYCIQHNPNAFSSLTWGRLTSICSGEDRIVPLK